MSYDEKCYDLAEAFLSDEPSLRWNVKNLAQAIQDTIEQWIQQERKDNPND